MLVQHWRLAIEQNLWICYKCFHTFGRFSPKQVNKYRTFLPVVGAEWRCWYSKIIEKSGCRPVLHAIPDCNRIGNFRTCDCYWSFVAMHLRGLSRRQDPKPFISVLQKLQTFSSNLWGENFYELDAYLKECNAYDEPDVAKLKIIDRIV